MDLNNIPEAFTLPLRLSIISYLLNGEKSFNELKNLTKASDGNIIVQLKKLEQIKYISSEKRFRLTKNITFYKITVLGIDEFNDYVNLLEEILKNNS